MQGIWVMCSSTGSTVMIQGSKPQNRNAAKGIRTPVVGVKGRHDWPLHYSSMHNVLYNFYTWR